MAIETEGGPVNNTDFFDLDSRIQLQVLRRLPPNEKRLIRSYFFYTGKLEPGKDEEVRAVLIKIRKLGNSIQYGRGTGTVEYRNNVEPVVVEPVEEPVQVPETPTKVEQPTYYPDTNGARKYWREQVGKGKKPNSPNSVGSEKFWRETVGKNEVIYAGKNNWDEMMLKAYFSDLSDGGKPLPFQMFPGEIRLPREILEKGQALLGSTPLMAEKESGIVVGNKRIGVMVGSRGILPEKLHRVARIFEAIIREENDEGLNINLLLRSDSKDMVGIYINQSMVNVVMRSTESDRMRSNLEIVMGRIWNTILRQFKDSEAFLDSHHLVRYSGDISRGILKRVKISEKSLLRTVIAGTGE